MASGPITSWQIDGETVSDFILGGSKITADGVVLEKTLESPLDCKEIQPVHPKGDQSWVFIGRTDVDAETPTLWLPDVKSWLIGKDPDAGKVLGQEEKGTTEDDIVGWHHRRDGYEFGWTLEAWRAAVHVVAKSRTQLSDWTELNSIKKG